MPEGRSLSAIEHEEKINHRRHNEWEEEPCNWTFSVNGRIGWRNGGTPYSNYQTDAGKNMRVFGKPESRACPKDEEGYSAERQEHAM